jgi:hypothetical protein
MTQQAVAQALMWSTSKIVRIEQGLVPVTPIDVKAMLELYGVTDKTTVDEMITLAIESRDLKGFKNYADVYSPTGLELFDYESAARAIFKHEPTVIPGLLQTQDYARALQIALGNSDEVVQRRLQARAERLLLLERDDRPELNFILGEASVSRPVGDIDVMREQIEALRKFAAQDGINLYLLPFSAGAHRGLGQPFTILQFRNENDADVLYLENAERFSVSKEDPQELRHFEDLFASLQEMAEKSGDFLTLLNRIVAERYP